jgi:hypothetical protein
MTSLNSARPVMQWNEHGVSVALWKRAHEGCTFYDISITRSYKKAETWQRTSYFRQDDLTRVIDLTTRAKDYLAKLPA